MSAHLYFKGKTFRFRVEAFCAIHCTIGRCQHTYTSKRKPSDSEWKPCVLYIVSDSTPILKRGNLKYSTLWVSLSVHLYFKEETLCMYIVGVSTPVLQRGNLMCCTLWVLASPYLRVESLLAVRLHCGCEHTCTSERKPYMLYVVCVSTSILQRGNCMWRV